MTTILIAEDDMDLNDGIKCTLDSNNFHVLQAFTLKQARQQLNNPIDLILLDINFPDGNGIDFCMELRRKSKVAVIFITANDREYDMVQGLELGGDDYIMKPFSPMVLRARIAAVLRRYAKSDSESIIIDDFRFDFSKMIFMKGEQKIILSKMEQKLLKVLVMNRDHILSKDRLIDLIWTDESEFVEENALIVTVQRLRKKLGIASKSDEYIQNVYGIGYVWKSRELE